jgi:small subunit ribosomal protein S21
MATNKHPRGQRGLYIEVKGGNIEQALRKLKRKINNEGIIQEVRDRKAFEPNHEKKKKAMAAAKSRLRKQQAKNNW